MLRRNGTAKKYPVILHLMLTIVETIANQNATVVEYKYSNDGQGNYELWVEQSDGITLWRTGRLMYTEDNKTYIQITGGYLYTDEVNNVRRIVTYVADQNGYRPTISKVVLELPPVPDRIPPRFTAGAVG